MVQLRNNSELQGEVPGWLADVRSEVRLGPNAFSYAADASPSLRRLFTRCRTDPSLLCAGLPPRSCAAFGANFVVALDDPSQCVECGASVVLPVVAMLLLLVAFAVGLAGYVRLIQKHPKAMRRGLTTVSILVPPGARLSHPVSAVPSRLPFLHPPLSHLPSHPFFYTSLPTPHTSRITPPHYTLNLPTLSSVSLNSRCHIAIAPQAILIFVNETENKKI